MRPWIRTLLGTSGFTLALGSAGFASGPELPVIRVTDDRIAAFEGTWIGRDNPSPVGPIDFAMDFRRESDGSLHSRSSLSRQTWIDLHFRKEADGWVLHESAGLAGLGEQAYPMHPVRAAADTVEWTYLKDRSYLSARTAVSGDRLYMQVFLRGRQHVLFQLERVTGETAAAVREQLKKAAEQEGDNDLARLEQAGGGDDPIDVRNARAKAKALPREAAAHVELGNAIAAVIDGAPPEKRIGYALEMLGAYRTAADLDPRNVGAHFGLSQYYLGAPPIAGGSLEKAEAEAETLAGLGSPYGEVVRAQLEARRGDPAAARERLRSVVEKHPDLALARRLLLSLLGKGDAPDGK